VQNGWVDYMVPQIYFSTGYSVVNYKKLTDWWAKHTYGRHLYIGQGTYKIKRNADSTWFDPAETSRQIQLNRSYPQVQGSIYFSSKSLLRNPNHVQDTLRANFYKYPALVPTMPWRDSIAPLAPENLKVHRHLQGITVQWKKPPKASDEDTAFYYVIYRFNKRSKASIEDPRNILSVYRGNDYTFVDSTVIPRKRYYYLVTALDRFHNESAAIGSRKIKAKRKKI
jgi:hypothetical protein